jgi:hypothetical protein
MTVTFEDGRKIKIWFERPNPSCTVCLCEYGDSVYNSVATCALSDHYNKATGRKVALTRFMKNGGFTLVASDPVDEQYLWRKDFVFTREMRRAVWTEYFKQHADLKHKAAKA